MIRVAVDAMGGDFAPGVVVEGTLNAVRRLPALDKILLVGQPAAIAAEFKRLGGSHPRIEVVPASEIVGMDEAPAQAIRRKKDSSISRAMDLVKNGQADAVFSAGNTGAMVAASTLKLRPIEGVERPAIAAVMPTVKEPFILIDAGGNTDCSAKMLVQFAAMGGVYAREILGKKSPRVGLLNIGGEQLKGNEITKETFGLLSRGPFNFLGNVEGHDMFEGSVDVVVCDGFVGNVVLKTSESVARAIGHWMKEEFTRNWWHKLGALMLYAGLKQMKKKSDPSAHGGAPLLGVNGVVIIGHGSSSAYAIENGIRVAGESVHHHLHERIAEEIRKANASLESIA